MINFIDDNVFFYCALCFLCYFIIKKYTGNIYSYESHVSKRDKK
jgi:hypothetical protein